MNPKRRGGSRRCAIIGAGPIGIEAAVQAASRGWEVSVFEAGRIGEHLLQYGETVLFTPFGMNSTVLGRERLRAAGHSIPSDDELLRADALVSRYLAPLAALPELRDAVRERARVTHVGRDGLSKGGGGAGANARREGRDFLIRVESPDGKTCFERADTVIDATGVYGQPNGTGPGGLPALGEDRVSQGIDRCLPSSLSSLRERVAGRRVLLLGDGHSAATVLRMFHDLSRAPEAAPARVHWVCRDRGTREPFPEVEGDPLPARRELAMEANRIARTSTWITTHRGATVLSYERSHTGTLCVTLSDGGVTRALEVDRILALVGYRPDLSITRELQVHHCYASEGPMKLAAAILSANAASPGGASDCLSQISHGPESLRNPEPGFFVLGAKSYGRNATFLLSLGHRQIEDVFALLDSEVESAPSIVS